MTKCIASTALFALLLAATGASAQTQGAEARASALVAKMTLAEKVSQLQNDAPAIPRLGVPAYEWWNEGLHGYARNGYATVFPQAIGLAASWDASLLQAVGTTVSVEARASFNTVGAGHAHGRYQGLTIWSPNINIDRDPRWGRGQETYGEDPFLTGSLAVAFVRGIQGDDPQHPRAIATPKHFVAHSGPEPGRDSFDAVVPPHDLEDTYLPAFRAAVTVGGAGSVMCSYNALDGVPMCANAALLDTRLRKDWGFKGYVVSDCDAVGDIAAFHHYKPDDEQAAAAALRAGTDLDCGHTYASVAKAVRQGDLAGSVLDASLVCLFAARYRLGELGGDDTYAHLGASDIDSGAHRKLALQAARESLVLLKNAHDTLPLRSGLRLAVIGPDADTLETLEANYHGTARAPVTPLEGLRARFGADRVSYAQGAPVAAGVPVPVPETALRTADGAAGLVGEYYTNPGFHGAPSAMRTDRVIDFDWDRVAPVAGLDAAHYAVRWRGELVPPGPGDYVLAVHVDRCFDCTGHDPVRLFVDGKPVIADGGSDNSRLEAHLHFADGRPHAVRLELVHASRDQGVRLQWLAPPAAQLAEVDRALRKADAVVAFVGLSPDVEGEALQIEVPGFAGGDRTSLDLPAPQRKLLEHAAASGKPLVVVLMSGGAVALDWAKQHAAAILAAWYPGQAGGTAIAQALAGDTNPGGRLPVTFYRSVRDLPPFASYAMQGRTYRYFRGTPLYPFGYGLSYTRFAYAAPALSASTLKAGDTLQVSAELRNAGSRAGDEVVQVYLDTPPSPQAPRHALAGFRRVHLAPGESRRVDFILSARDVSSVDAAGVRTVEPGRYRVFIGGGQPGDAAGVASTFTINGKEVLAP
ncbi:glycoside hydrolase family 3 C-terminal domain-containing protein [Rhodanobacter sp. Si-c]|uniref:Glycoside hydrolase family 3 C-terminal domain-containing protein n=1 Tax=Rhodanobacter lycopersici TaxID=3162487 RepID=A0ABV3QHG9_9GAMM